LLFAAVAVVDEDFLAVVPPLRDVVRRAHRHHASTARHGLQLGTGGQPLSKLRLSHFTFYAPHFTPDFTPDCQSK
jgi:hypothetical protein